MSFINQILTKACSENDIVMICQSKRDHSKKEREKQAKVWNNNYGVILFQYL